MSKLKPERMDHMEKGAAFGDPMWWKLKGKEKTKKIIGQICIVILLAVVISWIVAMIYEAGWSIAQMLWGTLAVTLFVLIILGAIFWGDK